MRVATSDIVNDVSVRVDDYPVKRSMLTEQPDCDSPGGRSEYSGMGSRISMGPIPQSKGDSMPKSLAQYLRTSGNLHRSWRKILQSASQSSNPDIRKEAKLFGENERRNLDRIQRQLRKVEFRFGEGKGILKEKGSGKDPRPIVIPGIEARIVLRAILNTIQTVPAVANYISQDGSFGGIIDKGVQDAIEMACRSIASGSQYFLRSDIAGFFTKIPRMQVLDQIADLLPDKSINQLLDEGTHLEISNRAILAGKMDLFPSDKVGVAQGYCLSPLMGNILLHEFDTKMNLGDVTAIRYIDDFLILGPTESQVKGAFERAKSMLKQFAMLPYIPGDGTGKAESGDTDRKFDFLGCTISPGSVWPNKEARKRIISKVRDILQRGENYLKHESYSSMKSSSYSLIQTLTLVNDTLRAWTNHYSFCNDNQALVQIDEKVDVLISKYLGTYANRRKRLEDPQARRRMFGVFLAADGKRDPILPIFL